MPRKREDLRDFVSVPLRDAMLCVDCECVTSSRSDNCPVCGSHSIFAVAPALGGTRLLTPEAATIGRRRTLRFDLEIRLTLRDVQARDVNALVEGITSAIPPSLAQQPSAFHLDVAPVMKMQPQSERRVA